MAGEAMGDFVGQGLALQCESDFERERCRRGGFSSGQSEAVQAESEPLQIAQDADRAVIAVIRRRPEMDQGACGIGHRPGLPYPCAAFVPAACSHASWKELYRRIRKKFS